MLTGLDATEYARWQAALQDLYNQNGMYLNMDQNELARYTASQSDAYNQLKAMQDYNDWEYQMYQDELAALEAAAKGGGGGGGRGGGGRGGSRGGGGSSSSGSNADRPIGGALTAIPGVSEAVDKLSREKELADSIAATRTTDPRLQSKRRMSGQVI